VCGELLQISHPDDSLSVAISASCAGGTKRTAPKHCKCVCPGHVRIGTHSNRYNCFPTASDRVVVAEMQLLIVLAVPSVVARGSSRYDSGLTPSEVFDLATP
jgi:hypothetical protein